MSVPRVLVCLALAVYSGGIVANTVFPIYLDPPPRTEPWAPAVALVPLAHYEWGDALMNVLVFIPLGVLLSLILVRPAWWRVTVAGAVVSAVIELLQLLTQAAFGGGHVTDVNDWLSNTVGAAIGGGVVTALSAWGATARMVTMFRWRDRSTGRPADV